MTGGWSGSSSNTELFNATQNKFINVYKDLPRSAYYHMVVPVNSTHVIFLGGQNNGYDVWMFNREENKWSALPDMPDKKQTPQVGK